MDNSDDYIVDDIILDDQTLAALNKAEQKYQSSAHRPQPVATKRLRTNNGWTPGIGSVSADEDLPDISLRGDGSYGFGTRTSPDVQIPGLGTKRPAPQMNAVNRLVVNSAINNLTAQRQRSNDQAVTALRTTKYRHSPDVRTHEGQSNTNTDARIKAHVGLDLQDQMSELQKKMDMLREENDKIQAELKAALDARHAKEGEVSILRRTIEKNSQNHAAQLQQLKAEREKAELKQTQIQKEMKAELERLRTQNLFKQQELEASSRKLPVSIRAKRFSSKEYPSTPVAIPKEMADWNIKDSSQRAMITYDTPIRSLRPQTKQGPHTRKSPEKTKKLPTIPGFDNAFTSTPTRSPSKRNDKGKEKAKQLVERNGAVYGIGSFNPPSQRLPASSFQPPSQPSHHIYEELDMMVDNSDPMIIESPLASKRPPPLSLGIENREDIVMEEADVFDPIKWEVELSRIILTHVYSPTGQIAFQQLLSAPQFMDPSNDYSKSCSQILEVVANSANSDHYEQSINILCTSLVTLLSVLWDAEQHTPLITLLNLLSKLVLSITNLQGVLLSSFCNDKGGRKLTFVDLICKILVKYVDPNKSHEYEKDVVIETLSLLEILCFRISRESYKKLEVLVRNRELLLLLFHNTQSVWLLERASMILVFLSTHQDLFRVILDVVNIPADNFGNPPSRNPLIERLCSWLLDTTQSPAENFKIYILIFFAQISTIHDDAFATLVASNFLIPAMIVYISYLTTAIYEDDESLVSSNEVTTNYIRTLVHACLLFHHLVFWSDPCLDLRDNLDSASPRTFNGIHHIFVVTFGRLSYCEPPIWVDPDGRKEFDYLTDVARDVLDIVVDGPEADSVWAGFGMDADGMDEDEMEARLLGNET